MNYVFLGRVQKRYSRVAEATKVSRQGPGHVEKTPECSRQHHDQRHDQTAVTSPSCQHWRYYSIKPRTS